MARHGNPGEVLQIGNAIRGFAEEIRQKAQNAARTMSGSSDWNDEHWARLNTEVSTITSPIATGADNLAEIAGQIMAEASKYE